MLWDLTLKEEHLERSIVWEYTDLDLVNPPEPGDW